jgi:hypothetical protein
VSTLDGVTVPQLRSLIPTLNWYGCCRTLLCRPLPAGEARMTLYRLKPKVTFHDLERKSRAWRNDGARRPVGQAVELWAIDWATAFAAACRGARVGRPRLLRRATGYGLGDRVCCGVPRGTGWATAFAAACRGARVGDRVCCGMPRARSRVTAFKAACQSVLGGPSRGGSSHPLSIPKGSFPSVLRGRRQGSSWEDQVGRSDHAVSTFDRVTVA